MTNGEIAFWMIILAIVIGIINTMTKRTAKEGIKKRERGWKNLSEEEKERRMRIFLPSLKEKYVSSLRLAILNEIVPKTLPCHFPWHKQAALEILFDYAIKNNITIKIMLTDPFIEVYSADLLKILFEKDPKAQIMIWGDQTLENPKRVSERLWMSSGSNVQVRYLHKEISNVLDPLSFMIFRDIFIHQTPVHGYTIQEKLDEFNPKIPSTINFGQEEDTQRLEKGFDEIWSEVSKIERFKRPES